MEMARGSLPQPQAIIPIPDPTRVGYIVNRLIPCTGANGRLPRGYFVSWVSAVLSKSSSLSGPTTSMSISAL